MTLFAYHDLFLQHTLSGHPECAERLISIISHLQKSPLWQKLNFVSPRYATHDELALIHTEEHIRKIQNFCKNGGGWLDLDTYCQPHSFDIARLAVGITLETADQITRGNDVNAFCAVRPPGHHATPNQSMGFCLFNNIAILAKYIQSKDWGKSILIIDWDVHHGNGTQDAFYNDPSISYFSIHRYPFYPGTGQADEKGAGLGYGTTMNHPISIQTHPDTMVEIFCDSLTKFAKQVHPDWLLISCGFDAYAHDPVGSLGLNFEHYQRLTHHAKQIAHEYCHNRIISILEGGYALEALGKLTATHLEVLI